MKKIVFILLVILTLSSLSSAAFLSDRKGLVGLDFPAVGGVARDSAGRIVSVTGVNLGLGISYKSYFEPLKQGWNGWWGVGTVILIIPYVGIGIDYVADNGWYVGVGIPTGIQGGYLF